MASKHHMQYGCGWCAPANWINFDASPTLRFERFPIVGKLYQRNTSRFPENVRYGDIISGLPISPGSCQAIYCSHVLEHLSLNDARTALRNTYAMLSPGGTFRFVLPDLEYLARTYVESEDKAAAHEFMRESFLGAETRPKTMARRLISILGNSSHLWMWDYKSMQHELESAGFTSIRRAAFGDAQDPMFRDVEDISRWENCLGIECRRPS